RHQGTRAGSRASGAQLPVYSMFISRGGGVAVAPFAVAVTVTVTGPPCVGPFGSIIIPFRACRRNCDDRKQNKKPFPNAALHPHHIYRIAIYCTFTDKI